jgi:hypothetical protein
MSYRWRSKYVLEYGTCENTYVMLANNVWLVFLQLFLHPVYFSEVGIAIFFLSALIANPQFYFSPLNANPLIFQE